MAPKKAKLEEMNSLLAAANATLATKQVRGVSVLILRYKKKSQPSQIH